MRDCPDWVPLLAVFGVGMVSTGTVSNLVGPGPASVALAAATLLAVATVAAHLLIRDVRWASRRRRVREMLRAGETLGVCLTCGHIVNLGLEDAPRQCVRCHKRGRRSYYEPVRVVWHDSAGN